MDGKWSLLTSHKRSKFNKDLCIVGPFGDAQKLLSVYVPSW